MRLRSVEMQTLISRYELEGIDGLRSLPDDANGGDVLPQTVLWLLAGARRA
jgi:hypothetical protein